MEQRTATPPARARGAFRRKWLSWNQRWRAFASVVVRLYPYVQKRRGQLALGLGLDLIYVFVGLLEPWPMKLIFDNVLLGQPLPTVLERLPVGLADDRVVLLNVLIGAIIVLAIVRGFLYYNRQVLLARAGQQIAAALRLDLYSHLHRLPFSYHERRRTGDLITRLTSDIQVLRELFTNVPLTLTSGFMVVAMSAVMLFIDWQLTLVALTVVPCIALLLRTYQRPMKEAIRKQRDREGRLATTASEVLGAIKVVQGFHREQYEVERFGSQNKRSLRSGVRAARLEAKLRWASELSVAVVTALVLGVAARRVLQGALSPGDLLVFVWYLQAFNRPLRGVSRLSQRSARATACGERILELLDTQPTVRDRPAARIAPHFRGEIEFQGVGFEHRADVPVLSDINLRIAPGERLSIVGPTGAGKTTLVSLIPRFYDPTHGRVCIDGQDVRDFTLASLRERISMVFQEPVLFATSIAENIAYGKPDASIEEIIRAAELAGIHRVIAALPDGYDTVLGERGGTLSGGQRQCVAIARAIIKDAPIVILDEPTVGLDNRSSALVMQALDRLMEGRTVIMISHQLRIAGTERVVVVEGGHIVEDGSREALMAAGGLYHRLELLQTGLLTP